MTETLRSQRAQLAEALALCERGAFPGSRAWREEAAALEALEAFDAAHPEVSAEILGERGEHVPAGEGLER